MFHWRIWGSCIIWNRNRNKCHGCRLWCSMTEHFETGARLSTDEMGPATWHWRMIVNWLLRVRWFLFEELSKYWMKDGGKEPRHKVEKWFTRKVEVIPRSVPICRRSRHCICKELSACLAPGGFPLRPGPSQHHPIYDRTLIIANPPEACETSSEYRTVNRGGVSCSFNWSSWQRGCDSSQIGRRNASIGRDRFPRISFVLGFTDNASWLCHFIRSETRTPWC
jgi:hypothetical protein